MDDLCVRARLSHFNAFFIVDCAWSASRCKGFAGCGISCRWLPFGISVYFGLSGFSIKGKRLTVVSGMRTLTPSRRQSHDPRLCLVDYHRFHFRLLELREILSCCFSRLRSVSPLALRKHLSIPWENRRRTQVESPEFARVLFFEIGATCVGRIEQTYLSGPQKRVAKRASFFGGLVWRLIGEGSNFFDPDLLEYSKQH